MSREVILRITNVNTYVESSLDSMTYQNFKKVMGFRDDKAMWRAKAIQTKLESEGKNANWVKKWDGSQTTVVYDKKTRRSHFPTGLLSLAREFFKDCEFDVNLVDQRKKIARSTGYSMTDEFELRDYQVKIRDDACSRGRGIIKMATGSGKTATAASIIASLSVEPTIFYVTSRDLLKQAKDEFERFIYHNGLPLEVGAVGGGNFDLKPITVMTVQTAIRALGERWTRFDDEDDLAKSDKQKLNDKQKKELKDFIQSAGCIFMDECQHTAAKTCQVVSSASESARYRYGLSVGPDSFVEMYGNCFSDGYHGSIESVWDIVSEEYPDLIYSEGGYEICDVSSLLLKSRGWNDDGFCWKKVKKIIRHKCPSEGLLGLRFRGKQKLLVTNDHSVFRVSKGDEYKWINGTKKYQGIIESVESRYMSDGDILIQDNGANWNVSLGEKDFDIINILSSCYHSPDKIRVRCDISCLSPEKIGITQSGYNQLLTRNPLGSSLSLTQYIALKNDAKPGICIPKPEFLYTEGASGVGIKPNIDMNEIAYILGFYLGDGWFDGNRINFSVEKDILSDFLIKISDMSSIVLNPKIRDMGHGSVEVRISNALLTCVMKYILEGSRYCYNKRLSASLYFSFSRETRLKLLQGLLDSDGSHAKDQPRNKQESRYTTTSYGLAQDVMSLVRSLGGVPSLSVQKPSKGGIINGRQIIGKRNSYQVIWSRSAIDGNNEGHFGNIRRFYYETENLHEVVLREITNEDPTEYVYDFEMENHPSFVANGILVHNSATPWRDEGDDMLIDSCFGKAICDISASFLIDRGYLIKPTIYFVHHKKPGMEGAYPTVYQEGIVENQERNLLISNISRKMVESGRQALILVRVVEHGNILEAMTPDSFFIHGSHTGKQREAWIDKMRNREAPITIATSIFDEGVDVKCLDSLVLAGSGKSQTRALQRVGRVLRPFTDKSSGFVKKDAFVVDFHDNMKYMLAHSRKRRKIYDTEPAFEIKDWK